MHINEIKRGILHFSTYFCGLLSVLFWILVIYGFDEPYAAGLTLISAVIHETGHILAIYLRKRGGRLRGALSGFRIKGDIFLSYKEDFVIALAGPMANICSVIISLPFTILSAEYGRAFASIGLATAAVNLLPIRGHDGYGMLCALLSEGDITGVKIRILDSVSLAMITSLCFVSLYLMDRLGEGYWVFGIFYTSMLMEVKRRVS